VDVVKVDLDVAYICKCFKCFITYVAKWFHLNVCNGYTRGFQVFSGISQVFQTYVASVLTILDVCCKCFSLYVAKVSGVTHVAVGPICSNRPAIAASACMRVGEEGARAETMWAQIETERRGTWSGHGTRSSAGHGTGAAPHLKPVAEDGKNLRYGEIHNICGATTRPKFPHICIRPTPIGICIIAQV
jgi:hypothetical protein